MSFTTIDISDHNDIAEELTKNDLNAVKVPDEVLVSETARDAVKLKNEIKNKSEIELQLKNNLQTSSYLNQQNRTVRSGRFSLHTPQGKDFCRLLFVKLHSDLRIQTQLQLVGVLIIVQTI